MGLRTTLRDIDEQNALLRRFQTASSNAVPYDIETRKELQGTSSWSSLRLSMSYGPALEEAVWQRRSRALRSSMPRRSDFPAASCS